MTVYRRSGLTGSGIPVTHGISPVPANQRPVQQATQRVSNSFQGFSGLFLGRVVRVDVMNMRVDVQLVTGGTLHDVPVLQSAAGTMEGIYGLPKIKLPEKKDQQQQNPSTSTATQGTAPEQVVQPPPSTATGQESQVNTEKKTQDEDDVDADDGRVDWKEIKDEDLDTPSLKRDTWAIISYVMNKSYQPVCLGFYFPHSTQMSIADRQKNKKDRIDYLRRLPGKSYELYKRDGTYEQTWSDGSHFRVGFPYEKPESDDKQDQQPGQVTPGQPSQASATPDLRLRAVLPPGGGDPASQSVTDQGANAPEKQKDEFYDDADDDPDARLHLGASPYENKDKEDKPWKIKKDEKKRRMMMVHSTKGKLGFCEHGAIHIQNYNDVAAESSPPDGYTDLDGGAARMQKISTGDLDAHQRRMWRARWGDQSQPPGDPSKLVVGEHWFDPQEKRDRYWLKAPSDGGGAGSLNDPSWQNSPETHSSKDGTGVPGEDGQGDSSGAPANRGADPLADPKASGQAQPAEVKLNEHGVYADAMVGGRQAQQKWAHNNGADIFLADNSDFRSPVDGTVHYFSGPGGSPLNNMGPQNSMDITMTSGPNAGAVMRVTHIAPGGTDGPVKAGDVIAKNHDDGLGNPNSPGGCNWQHFDVAISTTGNFHDGSPTNSGDINAPQWLQDNGFNISTSPGATGGPPELLAGGCPFDNAGGEGSAGEGSKQEAKRQWYMPAAVPAGGGVKNKVQPIGEKCLDSKAAEKGGRGIIDAAAADHVHSIKTGSDDDVQPVGGSGSTASAGDSSKGFAPINHQHTPGSGGSMLMMSHRDELLDKINALEARVLQLEAICH
jgi:hypothetical protein